MLTALDIALDYRTRLGPIVFCCWPDVDGRDGFAHPRPHSEKSIGKAPITPHGVDDATTDPDAIRRLCERYPLVNLAVSLEPAGLLLVDPDSREARLEAAGLGLPPTLIRISENPAYIYRRPPGAPITRTTHRGRSKAIDLMTSGYVMVHGRHRSGCDIYLEWLTDPEPAPEWAVRWLEEAVACDPVALPDDLTPVPLASLRAPDSLRRLIRRGRAVNPKRYTSRSEALWVAIRELICLGHDDATIAAVMLDPRNAVGEKARECGRKWLAHEIGRARKKPRDDGPDLAEALPLAGSSIGLEGGRVVRRLPAPTRPRGVPLPPPTRPAGVPLPAAKRGAA